MDWRDRAGWMSEAARRRWGIVGRILMELFGGTVCFGGVCRARNRKMTRTWLLIPFVCSSFRFEGNGTHGQVSKRQSSNPFEKARTNERLHGGHELSENRTEQAKHVCKMAPNHLSPFLFSATKSMVISGINDTNSQLTLIHP